MPSDREVTYRLYRIYSLKGDSGERTAAAKRFRGSPSQHPRGGG